MYPSCHPPAASRFHSRPRSYLVLGISPIPVGAISGFFLDRNGKTSTFHCHWGEKFEKNTWITFNRDRSGTVRNIQTVRNPRWVAEDIKRENGVTSKTLKGILEISSKDKVFYFEQDANHIFDRDLEYIRCSHEFFNNDSESLRVELEELKPSKMFHGKYCCWEVVKAEGIERLAGPISSGDEALKGNQHQHLRTSQDGQVSPAQISYQEDHLRQDDKHLSSSQFDQSSGVAHSSKTGQHIEIDQTSQIGLNVYRHSHQQRHYLPDDHQDRQPQASRSFYDERNFPAHLHSQTNHFNQRDRNPRRDYNSRASESYRANHTGRDDCFPRHGEHTHVSCHSSDRQNDASSRFTQISHGDRHFHTNDHDQADRCFGFNQSIDANRATVFQRDSQMNRFRLEDHQYLDDRKDSIHSQTVHHFPVQRTSHENYQNDLHSLHAQIPQSDRQYQVEPRCQNDRNRSSRQYNRFVVQYPSTSQQDEDANYSSPFNRFRCDHQTADMTLENNQIRKLFRESLELLKKLENRVNYLAEQQILDVLDLGIESMDFLEESVNITSEEPHSSSSTSLCFEEHIILLEKLEKTKTVVKLGKRLVTKMFSTFHLDGGDLKSDLENYQRNSDELLSRCDPFNQDYYA